MESFKTMFARFADIKTGALDETGMSINNVEAALKRVNIELRDTPTSFKNVSTVIEELSGKWDTLNEIEQSNLAKAIAGVRQRENFLVLMNNYNKVIEAQKIEMDSAGLAAQRYKIYLDSIEAATNKFTASWEKLWVDTFQGKSIKTVIDFGTTLLDLIDKIGLFNIAIVALSAYMSTKFAVEIPALTNLLIKLAVQFNLISATSLEAAASVATLSTTLSGVGIGLVLVGLAYAFTKLNTSMVDLYNNFEKQKAQVATNQEELSGLAKEYAALSDKAEKSTEDLVRLSDIQTILNVKYGASKDGINSYTDAINGNSTAIRENIKWIQEQQRIEALNFLEKNKFDYEDATKFLNNKSAQSVGASNSSYIYGTPEERIKLLDEEIQKGKDVYGLLRQQRDALYEQVDAAKKIVIETEHYKNLIDKSTVRELPDENARMYASGLKESADKVVELVGDTEDLISKNTELTDQMTNLIDAYTKAGELSMDQVLQLKKSFGEDYIKLITVEGDQIKLNTEAYKELIIKRWQDALAIAQQALNLDKNNEALKLNVSLIQSQIDSIRNGTYETKQSTDEQKKAYDELLKDTIDMIKERVNAEKDALQEELNAFKDMIDEKKKALQDAADAEKQGLQDQLDNYKYIIDAQKKLIDLKKAEKDQADAVAEKNKEIGDIDKELMELQFDNSEEAKAKRLELEAQRVAKTKELDKIQYDYGVDQQKQALDDEYAAFERENKKKQETIDKTLKIQLNALDKEYNAYKKQIDAKIKELNNYLNNTGQITADAMKLMESRTQSFFNDLIAWNKKFGSSVDNDIIAKWKLAFGYLEAYIQRAIFAASLGHWADYENSGGQGTDTGYTDPGTGSTYGNSAHHSGGFVGAPKLKSNEEFSKLLKGELVVTTNEMGNFMNKTLPTIANSGNAAGNGVSFDNLINLTVQGNMDDSILPKMEKIVSQAIDKLNKTMNSRGIYRNANSFSI